MFDFDAPCPHCDKRFRIDRIGPEAREFIQCPHCRRVIKIDVPDPENKTLRAGSNFGD